MVVAQFNSPHMAGQFVCVSVGFFGVSGGEGSKDANEDDKDAI
jgi:hypothetical protein